MTCSTCGEPLHASGCARCQQALVEQSLDALGRLTFNRALELARAGNVRAAEETLCAACSLMPTAVAPRRALGKLRASFGDLDGAEVDLSLATHLHPDDVDAQKALVGVRRALRLRRLRHGGLALAVVTALVASLVLTRGWQ